jgi:hypothetical protein
VNPGEHQGKYRTRPTKPLAIMAVFVVKGAVFGATLYCAVSNELIPQLLEVKMRGSERGQGAVLFHFITISRPQHLNRL